MAKALNKQFGFTFLAMANGQPNRCDADRKLWACNRYFWLFLMQVWKYLVSQ